jgi:glycerophosphoryl diester phosphodiesterase
VARVIAHRGASASFPENTLPALQHAAAAGASWVEIDVRRTADGVVVLGHDPTWLRTAGNPRRVRDLTWEATRRLDAGAWKGYPGVAPPSLDAVLLACPALHIDVELKDPADDPDLAATVRDVVRAHGAASRVVLTSFDHACIDALAETATDLSLGYIAATPLGRIHPGVRLCALQADLVEQRPACVAAAREAGCKVWVWTVDDVERARRLARQRVDGIVTNDPERFLKLSPEFV